MTRREFPRLPPPPPPPPETDPFVTRESYRRPGLQPSEIERRLARVIVWALVILVVLTIGAQLGIRQGRALERAAMAARGLDR